MARKRKFNKGISRLIRNNFPKIIDAIKEGNETGGDGSDKLDAAAKFLNKHVDIPMLPEYLEEMLFKFAITAIVEAAIHVWGENEWFDMLIKATGIDPDPEVDSD